MGIIENIKTNMEERRLRRMENDLEKINKRNNISFNPATVKDLASVSSEKSFSYRALENYTWYSASIPLLRAFYRKQKGYINGSYSDDNYQYFWANVPNKNRKVHTKIPSLASRKMADLIIGNGVVIRDECYTEAGEIDEAQTNAVQDVIKEIYNENNIYKLLTSSIINESWSGSTAWKIIIDSEFSKLPIIDETDVRNVEVITKHKRIVGLVFKNWYEKGADEKDATKYVHSETYTTNENGDAVIINELHKLVSDRLVKVSLNEIDETKDLEETQVFNGLKGMIAGFKPNKTPNAEFMNSPYGESDYAGCYSLFDSADEIYSTMIDDVRKGRTKRFIPDSMIPKGADGQPLGMDDFELDYEKVEGSDASSLNEENTIITSTPPSRTTEYIDEWRSVLTTILNNIGLSPITIGVTGLESINTSDNSQREREKVSLRTRETKCKLWSEFLREMTMKLLKTYQYMTDNVIGTAETGLERINVDEKNMNIIVDFGEYFTMPFEERIATFAPAKQSGVISVEELVEQIYKDDKTEEEKAIEVNRLKAEAGMSLSNVDNLEL